MATIVFLMAAGLLWSNQVYAKNLYGKVIGISDGDTITVLRKRKQYKIRLLGIDCPEKAQAFGDKAKQLTARLAFGKKVKVGVEGKDRYQRYLGIVYLPKNLILNEELMRQGFAWHYAKYSDDPILQSLENEARKSKVGLWADKNPIPPWEFRRKK